MWLGDSLMCFTATHVHFFVGGVLDQWSVDQPSLINRPWTNRPLPKRPYTV